MGGARRVAPQQPDDEEPVELASTPDWGPARGDVLVREAFARVRDRLIADPRRLEVPTERGRQDRVDVYLDQDKAVEAAGLPESGEQEAAVGG